MKMSSSEHTHFGVLCIFDDHDYDDYGDYYYYYYYYDDLYFVRALMVPMHLGLIDGF
jgi:hypothetical protein